MKKQKRKSNNNNNECNDLHVIAYKILDNLIETSESSYESLSKAKEKLKKIDKLNGNKETKKQIKNKLTEFEEAIKINKEEINEYKIIKNSYNQLYQNYCEKNKKRKKKK